MAVYINERNIKILATEMFRVSKNLAPPQMVPHYNLKYDSWFSRPFVKSVYKSA